MAATDLLRSRRRSAQPKLTLRGVVPPEAILRPALGAACQSAESPRRYSSPWDRRQANSQSLNIESEDVIGALVVPSVAAVLLALARS